MNEMTVTRTADPTPTYTVSDLPVVGESLNEALALVLADQFGVDVNVHPEQNRHVFTCTPVADSKAELMIKLHICGRTAVVRLESVDMGEDEEFDELVIDEFGSVLSQVGELLEQEAPPERTEWREPLGKVMLGHPYADGHVSVDEAFSAALEKLGRISEPERSAVVRSVLDGWEAEAPECELLLDDEGDPVIEIEVDTEMFEACANDGHVDVDDLPEFTLTDLNVSGSRVSLTPLPMIWDMSEFGK